MLTHYFYMIFLSVSNTTSLPYPLLYNPLKSDTALLTLLHPCSMLKIKITPPLVMIT